MTATKIVIDNDTHLVEPDRIVLMDDERVVAHTRDPVEKAAADNRRRAV